MAIVTDNRISYVYRRLKPATDGNIIETRLVQLKPGQFEDEIHVVLQHFQLESIAKTRREANLETIPWQALSYACGDQSNRENVVVELPNGQHNREAPEIELRYISVTKSLTEALRHLRQATKSLLLWVDALSIDQATDNLAQKERAEQVKNMHVIYGESDGVIIWLGPEENDSNYAVEFLWQLGSLITVNWDTFDIIASDPTVRDVVQQWTANGRSSREQKAVWELLGRPWFKRLWIRQEAILADEETSLVLCGSATIYINPFRKAIHCISWLQFGPSDDEMTNQDRRLERAAAICQRTYIDAPNLMANVRLCDCTDDRDRIFANLGLLSMKRDTALVRSITIDYKDSTPEQVYLDFFLRYLERYNTLRLLTSAGVSQGSNMRPTWALDLRVRHPVLDYSMESASSHCAMAEYEYKGNGVLKAVGCGASEISDTHILMSTNSGEEKNDWWQAMATLISARPLNVDRDTWIDRFTELILFAMKSMIGEMEEAALHRKALTSYFNYLYDEGKARSSSQRREVNMPNEMIRPQTAKVLGQCIRLFGQPDLPFIITVDGHIGIGKGIQRGDTVFAILGSKALIALRSTKDDTYQVVGPVFLHGLNWGEALLGPMPEHVTVEPYFEPTRGAFVPHYVNSSTGESSMWDPRVFWNELDVHPPMNKSFVPVTAPQGQPLRERPDSAYLRRHGVQLQELLLV